jgi:hypothetical protein
MTDLRDAARQALEALETVFMPHHPAVIALKAALAEEALQRLSDANQEIEAALEQPEQEPVAWMYVGLNSNNIMHGPHLVWRPEHMDAMSAEKGVVASPLYTHPPRREWRGLTEEEIQSIHDTYHKRMGPQEFARAIEAALKERNL